MERELTPEAQADRDEFNSASRGCACHTGCAPCSHCTHPGNPLNQEDDEFWQEVKPASFVRENRYIVIKKSDLEKLDKTAAGYWNGASLLMLNVFQHLPKRECLVLESDWPEYESAWASIERRMTGLDTELADAAEAWNGEGLPPVGTVCEVQTWVNREWRKTTVLAHCLGFAVHSWSTDGDDMEVDAAPAGDFRPIRTPEQIAAEQYELDAEEIAKILDGLRGANSVSIAKTLLDCGYAKQVQP